MSADEVLREFTREQEYAVTGFVFDEFDIDAMAQEIEELREEVAEQKARVADLELALFHADNRGEPEHRRDA